MTTRARPSVDLALEATTSPYDRIRLTAQRYGQACREYGRAVEGAGSFVASQRVMDARWGDFVDAVAELELRNSEGK